MNENKSKYEFDAKKIIEMLLKRWWIIVIATALMVAGAFAYTQLTVTPTYTSSATLLINAGTNLTSYQQILAGQYQSKDYPYILKSYDTLDEAARNLSTEEKTYTAAKLSGMVSGYAEEDSRIFVIAVTSTDPEEAKLVADAVSEVFKTRVNKITDAMVQDVETPRVSSSASSAGLKRNILLGAAGGVVIGAVIAILLGLGSDVLESEEWLLKNFKDEAPLLATIPDASNSGGRSYYRYKYKRYYQYSSRAAKKENKSK